MVTRIIRQYFYNCKRTFPNRSIKSSYLRDYHLLLMLDLFERFQNRYLYSLEMRILIFISGELSIPPFVIRLIYFIKETQSVRIVSIHDIAIN